MGHGAFQEQGHSWALLCQQQASGLQCKPDRLDQTDGGLFAGASSQQHGSAKAGGAASRHTGHRLAQQQGREASSWRCALADASRSPPHRGWVGQTRLVRPNAKDGMGYNEADSFWKAYLSIKQPLTAHDPIHPQVSGRHDPTMRRRLHSSLVVLSSRF